MALIIKPCDHIVIITSLIKVTVKTCVKIHNWKIFRLHKGLCSHQIKPLYIPSPINVLHCYNNTKSIFIILLIILVAVEYYYGQLR